MVIHCSTDITFVLISGTSSTCDIKLKVYCFSHLTGMANRTTLVDNNTWNNSHIALVGKAMSSTEDKAYVIMRMLDVDYVLVIFGGMIGYSGDDINKFLWMVRIAEGEHPQDIKVCVA